ncbi:pyrimidine 5-nucleotidase [Ascodesmis nigricans]|uniref:Pyrimidine 5-nucleotidase n=1 Tax=Ascodesmis nigricans TaxID=341454 RepID=A0A4S2N1N4_9PEZI|nr:pyrimidine 5-nucleotidase [Ascodesmis nigricans]
MTAAILATCLSNGASSDGRPVFFFDIDNCLYPRSKKVHDMMKDLIRKYFTKHLELTADDARQLHEHYYRQYGLAIEGLVRHHKIDPMEYNRLVDDALPLENVLHPDEDLRNLILSIDRSKVKLWLFTNAYVTHGQRVVRLLGVEDLFDGMTFCDYAEGDELVCKPKKLAYERAMEQAGVSDKSKCFFIDDSWGNCRAAEEFGWGNVVLKLEPEDPEPEKKPCKWEIKELRELRDLFPELFKGSK